MLSECFVTALQQISVNCLLTVCASAKLAANLGCKIFSCVPSTSWWLLLLPHTYTSQVSDTTGASPV